MDGFDHFMVVQSRFYRYFCAPVLFKAGAYIIISDELVFRETDGHAAEIACSLDVVVAAERICAGARLHIVSSHQQQVGYCRTGVTAAAVLRYSRRRRASNPLLCRY